VYLFVKFHISKFFSSEFSLTFANYVELVLELAE